MGRFGDVLVGAAGNVAGTVVDPRAGFGRLRSAMSPRVVVAVTAGLVIGCLVARARWSTHPGFPR